MFFMESEAEQYSDREIGRRLEALRLAKGIAAQNMFAQLIGAQISQYNNWETGRRRITVDFAIKICVLTGATLDYIYRGDVSSLPLSLVGRLPTASDKR